MSIGTYAALQTGAKDQVNRTDITDTQFARAVQMTEAAAKRRLDVLSRVRQQQSYITGQAASLPSDFKAVVNLVLDASPDILFSSISESSLHDFQSGQIALQGQAYALVGRQMHFWPALAEDTSVTLTYEADLVPLADDQPTNWMLDEHPDAYLYGVCSFLGLLLMDADLRATYGALFASALDDIQADDLRQRTSERLTPTVTMVV